MYIIYIHIYIYVYIYMYRYIHLYIYNLGQDLAAGHVQLPPQVQGPPVPLPGPDVSRQGLSAPGAGVCSYVYIYICHVYQVCAPKP